jgi:hypothetical protein
MTDKVDGKPLKRVDDELWACKDGRILYVSEMSEDHVRAVLQMILRKRRKMRQLKAMLMEIATSDEPFWDSDDK